MLATNEEKTNEAVTPAADIDYLSQGQQYVQTAQKTLVKTLKKSYRIAGRWLRFIIVRHSH